MNYKDQLKELAWTVYEGLQKYISVHNIIIRDSATIMSFFKNLFGKGVPMSKLLEYAESLVPVWTSISDKLTDFKSNSYFLLSNDEKKYFDILSKYVDAIQMTVFCLVERQKLMHNGSKSIRDNPITYKVFQEQDNAYKLAITKYISIGQQLNDVNYIIFN